MQIINYKFDKSIRKDIEPLYLSAFPEEERPPVNIFFEKANNSNNELLGFYDNNQFIGFTNLLFYQDICYIFFLAVSPSKRNKGYGSNILTYIKQKYTNYVLLLCYDEVDPKYSDNSTRIRRRDFYYRNGFKNNKIKTCEYFVRYDTCYIGNHQVSFNDYLNIYISNFGDYAKDFVKEAK